MRPRYVTTYGVREDMGFAVLDRDMLGILAPAEYAGPALIDPSKATGYMHCYLRPFQSLMLGRWNVGKGGIVQFRNLRTIVYVLVEEPGFQGLRCGGAIALAKARRGFTLALFPCTERRDTEKREVDHFSAHLEFENGKIIKRECHIKMRKEGTTHPNVNVPLEKMISDDYHFAFEYWIGDVLFLDPAGSIVSPLKSVWSTKGRRELESSVNNARISTMGCSLPTLDGVISSGPLLIRIGLLTEQGIVKAGSVQRALSPPHVAHKGEHATRIHRCKDISKLDSDWPSDISLFVEVGLLRFRPPKHYSYPDLRRSTFESM